MGGTIHTGPLTGVGSESSAVGSVGRSVASVAKKPLTSELPMGSVIAAAVDLTRAIDRRHRAPGAQRTPTRLIAASTLDSELRSFTYRDLLEMEENGIIGEDERVELLGGRIYRMTIKPPHAWAVAALTQRFSVAFDGRATVATQQPLRLSDDTDDTELPQPDVMLLREASYLDHPRPDHVALLVEVSDSTLRKDTAIKLPLYAQVGIPELWIVNLVQRRIEVYIDPEGSDFRYRAFHELTATLAPRAFADTARQWLPDTLTALLDRHDVSGSAATS